MGETLITVVLCAAVFAGELLVSRRIGPRHPMAAVCWYAAWTVICVGFSAFNLATGQPGWALWMAACAAINGRSWWKWNRRKRKRAGALAGAKSRARLAALVRKVREAAQPRPVRRPARDGVR